MRNPLLPPLMLLILAAALYMVPDGSFHFWQLSLRGAFARLYKPADPRSDAADDVLTTHRDLVDLLSQKNAEIADLRRRLRELSVTTELVDRARIVPARVVRLGPDNNLDTFTIDVGTADEVGPGQAVVVGQALVGVVVRSELHASLVLSLASTGSYISARFGDPEGAGERPRVLGAVQGAGMGAVRAIVFSSSTAAQEGWLAMTSGLEKRIPEGLIMGTITGRFADGREGGTMEAELRPAMDLTSIDYVTVVAKL